jgi:hypothetical protein
MPIAKGRTTAAAAIEPATTTRPSRSGASRLRSASAAAPTPATAAIDPAPKISADGNAARNAAAWATSGG